MNEAWRQLALPDTGEFGRPSSPGLWQLHQAARGATHLGPVSEGLFQNPMVIVFLEMIYINTSN